MCLSSLNLPFRSIVVLICLESPRGSELAFPKSISNDTSKTRSQSKLLVAGCKFKSPKISQPTTTSVSRSKAGRNRKTKHRFFLFVRFFSLFSRGCTKSR